MFGHQKMFDGVWSPNIYRLSRPLLVNQQCVVYEFQYDPCGVSYTGYASRHLHLRTEEHKYFAIGKHLKEKHNQTFNNFHEQFNTL